MIIKNLKKKFQILKVEVYLAQDLNFHKVNTTKKPQNKVKNQEQNLLWKEQNQSQNAPDSQ